MFVSMVQVSEISTALSGRLRITSSWYQLPDLHHWTWYNNAWAVAYEVGHIRVTNHWRIFQNSTASWVLKSLRLIIGLLFQHSSFMSDHERSRDVTIYCVPSRETEWLGILGRNGWMVNVRGQCLEIPGIRVPASSYNWQFSIIEWF